MNNFFEELKKLESEKISYVVITLVKIIGSSPQDLGAKAIVTADGLYFGTVGGGKIEAHAIARAKELLIQKIKFEFNEWNLQSDIGMTCGGVVSLSFELNNFESNFKVAIFGAGHVAQAVIEVLSKLDCSIICFDPRLEWLQKIKKQANITIVHSQEMEKEIEKLSDEYFILSLTMGHAYDRPVLASALQRQFKFVGVIGSAQKSAVLRHELKTLNLLTDNQISKLVCPIGEPIGNNHPFEIAISIIAQLLRIRK